MEHDFLTLFFQACRWAFFFYLLLIVSPVFEIALIQKNRCFPAAQSVQNQLITHSATKHIITTLTCGKVDNLRNLSSSSFLSLRYYVFSEVQRRNFLNICLISVKSEIDTGGDDTQAKKLSQNSETFAYKSQYSKFSNCNFRFYYTKENGHCDRSDRLHRCKSHPFSHGGEGCNYVDRQRW